MKFSFLIPGYWGHQPRRSAMACVPTGDPYYTRYFKSVLDSFQKMKVTNLNKKPWFNYRTKVFYLKNMFKQAYFSKIFF